MPRDSSGLYTLPPGNPVIDGTIIDTAWANPTMADIANQLNNVLTRDGLLGPTDQLKAVDGTALLPGYAFAAAGATGLFRTGTYLGFSWNGVEQLNVGANGAVFSSPAHINVSTTTPAVRITQDGTGDVVKFESSAGDTRPNIINTDGQLVLGFSTAQPIGAASPKLQTLATSGSAAAIAQHLWNNTNTGPIHYLYHSRGATIGSHAILQANDTLGDIRFHGDDGATEALGAVIRGLADLTPAAGSMPGRIAFFTAPAGTVTPFEGMRIDSQGRVIVAPGGAAAQTSRIATTSIVPWVQLNGDSSLSQLSIASFSWHASTSACANLMLAHSKSGVIGTHTPASISSNNDILGRLSIAGSDGVKFVEGGRIEVSVDGTPAVDRMPSEMLFYLMDDAGVISARFTLQKDYAHFGVPITAMNGQAAAPSITFTTDLTTGFWHPAANEIALVSSGVPRFRLNTVANVCILASGATPLAANMNNAEVVFSRSTDTALRISMRGNDGVVRSGVITLT